MCLVGVIFSPYKMRDIGLYVTWFAIGYTAAGKAVEVVLRPVGVNGVEPVKATKIAAGTKVCATVTTAEKITLSSDFLVK